MFLADLSTINGADVTTLEQEEVTERVQAAPNPFELTLSRVDSKKVYVSPRKAKPGDKLYVSSCAAP